jgi:hypothetical protein
MMRNTFTHGVALAVSILPLLALGGGCAAETSPADESVDNVEVGTSNVHLMKMNNSSEGSNGALITASAPAGAHLTYYGGPVLSNVKVYTIFWNSSVPSQASLNSFYSTITSSAYFDWLTEYNTPTQTIGHGSLGGSVVDTGAPAGTNISDAQIQAEISRLISAGQLPANDGNNLYMVHFPAGISITQGTSKSCVQFCAYHGTYVRGGKNAYYGVIPDLSGGCASGCGSNTKLNNTTSVASHELIEAVTDAAVGLATNLAAPLAWYDNTNGEIGDICNGQQGSVAGFTVQLEFSNQLKNCIATKTTTTPPPPTTCAHAICTSGTKLVSSCDPCATKVCAADSYCCSTAWDGQCVSEVTSICGKSCP